MNKQQNSDLANSIGRGFAEHFGTNMLDSDNILWRLVDGVWMGKRSVFTNDNKTKWLEEVDVNNIQSWWCGKYADYKEIFK